MKMLKKSIATALLVAMVAWIELALAPMFIMHVWHVQPAAEVAGHMAAHLAAPQHAMPAGHVHRGHLCCPGPSTGDANTHPFEIASSSLPCQAEHRCCFQQGPQNVPVPVSASRGDSRNIANVGASELSTLQNEQFQVSLTTAAITGPPPGIFGVILRI